MSSPRKILDSLGHRPHKRWGQNFLRDQSLAQSLIRKSLLAGCGVLEIGPGLGMMTADLVEALKKQEIPWLTAVEVDPMLTTYLKSQFSEAHPRLLIEEADVLSVSWDKLLPPEGEVQVIANLPYNISTPVFFHLLNIGPRLKRVSVMVQREVGQRLLAKPGDEAYGRLSILPQILFEIKTIKKIGGHQFYPPAKVDSEFLVMNRRQSPLVQFSSPAAEQMFEQVVKAIFQSRRKTLKNSLRGIELKTTKSWSQLFEELQIDEKIRGELLDIVMLAKLAEAAV